MLGNHENKPHDKGKNRDSKPFVGEDIVDFIAGVSAVSENFSGFNFLYDSVHEFKAFSVRGKNFFLAGKVDISLFIGCFLTFSGFFNRGFNNFLKSFAGGGGCVDHRAAEFFGKELCVDFCFFFCVHVRFVKSNNNRDSKFEKLGCEEKASGKIGRINDVDDNVRIFVFYIIACNAFFGSEGRHGICTRKVNGDKFLRSFVICFFDGVFFLFNGNARPVSDFFVAAGDGVIHCCFAAVRVARKRNSH